MKLNFKKIYSKTIKTLEAHQTELSIALTAISLLAFMPEDLPEDVQALKHVLEMMRQETDANLAVLLDMQNQAENVKNDLHPQR